MGGFELEAWLVDEHVRPAPVNETFLRHLDNPMVVPELARFNVELNDHPQHLWGSALGRFEASLGATWNQCRQAAAALIAFVLRRRGFHHLGGGESGLQVAALVDLAAGSPAIEGPGVGIVGFGQGRQVAVVEAREDARGRARGHADAHGNGRDNSDHLQQRLDSGRSAVLLLRHPVRNESLPRSLRGIRRNR